MVGADLAAEDVVLDWGHFDERRRVGGKALIEGLMADCFHSVNR